MHVHLAHMHTNPNIDDKYKLSRAHEELTAMACTTYTPGVGVAACVIATIGFSECGSHVRYGVVERSYSTRSRFEAALWNC